MSAIKQYSGRDVTFYIPCYQAERTIAACLNAVWRQTARPARIFCVDDGSEPPLAGVDVEIVRHPANQGLAAARNTALRACRTPLIAALDADVSVEPDWLAQLLEAMHATGVDGVGGRLDERHRKTLGDQWRVRHMAQHFGEAPATDPRLLFGSNTLFRADALREAGGYDYRLRTNNEDRTMCEAIYAGGGHLYYTPLARAWHERRDTAKTILRGYWQWHHAAGLVRGDFDSIEGVRRRIDAVNFGIFRHRFDLDSRAGCNDLLGLDAAIPWVFGALDCRFAARRMGLAAPVFPFWEWQLSLPVPAFRVITALMAANTPPRAALPPTREWWNQYRDEFMRGLRSFRWFADCSRIASWARLDEEIQACDV